MNFLRIYGKRFATTSKTLKFQNVNKDIKYSTQKLDIQAYEDKLRVVNKIIIKIYIEKLLKIKSSLNL